MSQLYTLVDNDDNDFRVTLEQTRFDVESALNKLAPGEAITIARDPLPLKEFHAYYMGHATDQSWRSTRGFGFGQHRVIKAVDFKDAAVQAFDHSQHSTGARYLITGVGPGVVGDEQQACFFKAIKSSEFGDWDLHVDLNWGNAKYRHGYYRIKQIAI